MHRNRPPFTPRQLGDGAIERLAHRVWGVRGDAEAKERRGEGAKPVERSPQLLHAGGALCRTGTEDLLVVDPPAPEAPGGGGHAGFGAQGSDGAAVVKENGAVLEGGRGTRMQGPGRDAEH